MWLVANDIIIGLAIGSFLMTNNAAMADRLHRILHVNTKSFAQKYIHVCNFLTQLKNIY